jgi:hypothetical protein
VVSIITQPALAGKPTTTEILYDDFSGGEASYVEKWSLPFYGIAGETLASDGGNLNRDLSNGTVKLQIPEFTAGSDFIFFDHIKYLATSNQLFDIPAHGSIAFYMDIDGTTLGIVPGLIMEGQRLSDGETLRYTLLDGQQACVTMHMLNFGWATSLCNHAHAQFS